MTMKRARLEVSDPLGRTRIVPIKDERFTIGRSHGNSMLLGSPEISRLHAEIVKEGDRYTLRDLGSRAGTFVNEETVVEHTLGYGDRIRFGRHSNLRFLLEDTTETATRATTSAVGDLRQSATLLEGLRALGTAKVIDQVLAMVVDYADHPVRRHLPDQPEDSRAGVRHGRAAARRRPARADVRRGS